MSSTARPSSIAMDTGKGSVHHQLDLGQFPFLPASIVINILGPMLAPAAAQAMRQSLITGGPVQYSLMGRAFTAPIVQHCRLRAQGRRATLPTHVREDPAIPNSEPITEFRCR